jgi:RHS repeat-associated protein
MQTAVSERLADFEVSSGEILPQTRFCRKELDAETGFYYYGARYLNPKTSMWISADPAMGDYVPRAPVDDEAKKHNENLPGMGGVYNYVNMHVYHYAGNNPVRYSDPTGMWDIEADITWIQGKGVTDEDIAKAKDMARNIANSDTIAGSRLRSAMESGDKLRIEVNNEGKNYATPGDDADLSIWEAIKGALWIGGDAYIQFDPNTAGAYADGATKDPESILAHEIGHAYLMMDGRNPWTRKGRELDGTAVENQYRVLMRSHVNLTQRKTYPNGDEVYILPQYNRLTSEFYIYGTTRKYCVR